MNLKLTFLPLLVCLLGGWGCKTKAVPVMINGRQVLDSIEYWAIKEGLPSTDYVLRYSDSTKMYRIYWYARDVNVLSVIETGDGYTGASPTGENPEPGSTCDFPTKEAAVAIAAIHYKDILNARSQSAEKAKETAVGDAPRTDFKPVK